MNYIWNKFFRDFFIVFIYVYGCVCVHQKKALDFLHLVLKVL